MKPYSIHQSFARQGFVHGLFVKPILPCQTFGIAKSMHDSEAAHACMQYVDDPYIAQLSNATCMTTLSMKTK